MKPRKPYTISPVVGSDGKQWVVGKDNSLTELFYFDHAEKAMRKLVELEGVRPIAAAWNSSPATQEIIDRIKFQVGAIRGALIAVNHTGALTYFDETIRKTEALPNDK